MIELAVATTLFFVAFGSILLGLRVRRVLPRHLRLHGPWMAVQP